MGRVLVTSKNVLLVQDEYADRLRAAGLDLVLSPKLGTPHSEDDLLALLPGCVAAVAMPDRYTARVLEAAAPALKIIARVGVGVDSIDLAAASRLGVWACVAPGNHRAVADYALLLVLALARDYVRIVNQTRAGAWERVSGLELAGATLAVIGTGRIGREVTARAQGFGMRVVAHDVYEDAAWAAGVGVSYLPLADALAQADVITLHAPLLPETRHMINAASLAGCKRGVLIVNTARGPLIHEPDLAAALDSGQVGGAALDVFDREPPVDRTLIDHPRVLASSHCASETLAANRLLVSVALDEVLRVARGERPLHAQNEPAG
ncbi:MAG: phosphoglycerate dehydrogenase [Chloroflexi bacterium]|nr:phosphoglycerate dehydrogenase [Chloroflexota bacterium]